jgi:rod shape-determining protein MreC
VYDKTVRRRRAVLGLLVACSLILLTAYFGESTGGGLHSVQRGVVEVVSPIQEGANRALKPVRDLVGWVGDTIDAKGEVKQLRAQRNALRSQAITGAAAERENAQLRNLLSLDRARGLTDEAPVTARVLGQDPNLWWSQVLINKGTNDGVLPNHPVVGPEGLVGIVSDATSGSAIVTLLTSHTMAVGAKIAESGVGGTIQAVEGRPNDLLLQYTTRNDEVSPGQNVITAGTQSRTDRVTSLYPPRIPIGRVTRVDDPGTDNQIVHVRPFANMHRLDFVQVLTRTRNAT